MPDSAVLKQTTLPLTVGLDLKVDWAVTLCSSAQCSHLGHGLVALKMRPLDLVGAVFHLSRETVGIPCHSLGGALETELNFIQNLANTSWNYYYYYFNYCSLLLLLLTERHY